MALPYEEFLQVRTAAYNNLQGNLKYYDCSDCKNKGYIAEIVDGNEVMIKCKCMKIRNTLMAIDKSGLTLQLQHCTFEQYKATESWNKKLKKAAEEYVANHNNRWLVMMGQNGAGKTHLCTAALIKLILSGKSGKYMLWRAEATKLLGKINSDDYQDELNKIKNVDVLYIDDLFKTKKNEKLSAAEIKLAFDIINHRAINYLQTIISTELLSDELMNEDEAIGSRLKIMSGIYFLDVLRDRARNYRLK